MVILDAGAKMYCSRSSTSSLAIKRIHANICSRLKAHSPGVSAGWRASPALGVGTDVLLGARLAAEAVAEPTLGRRVARAAVER